MHRASERNLRSMCHERGFPRWTDLPAESFRRLPMPPAKGVCGLRTANDVASVRTKIRDERGANDARVRRNERGVNAAAACVRTGGVVGWGSRRSGHVVLPPHLPHTHPWARVLLVKPRGVFQTALLLSLLGMAGASSVGCSEPKVSLGRGAREYTDSDYPQVLERWTRTKSLVAISELDNLLTVTATFESWDFRWAYVVKYANDYRLTVEQRRTLLERTLAETQDSHRFYVALYGTKVRWSDLTKPQTAWIVRLIDDEGNETAPTSIELVARPGPLEIRYFPYSTVWRNIFRVKFPTTTPDGRSTIGQSARWFGLRFAGAEGNEELRWDIETTPSGTPKRTALATPEGTDVVTPRR